MEYIIGVDGGGRKTVSATATLKGEIIGMGKAGPTNINIADRETVARELEKTIKKAMEMGSVKGKAMITVLGIAGTERKRCSKIIREICEELKFAEKIIIVSDAMIALTAATKMKPGIIIISGTGSIALGINREKQIARAGGWGYLLDDEGSGYWIGLKALRKVMKAYDGRGKTTLLTSMILEKFKIEDPSQLVDIAYGRKLTVSEIASIAETVSKCASMGDEVAIEILRKAGEKLGEMILTVIRKLKIEEEIIPIYYSGGVFNAGKYILKPIKEKLREKQIEIKLEKSFLNPVVGALMLGLNYLGIEVKGEVEENLIKTARKWGLINEGN